MAAIATSVSETGAGPSAVAAAAPPLTRADVLMLGTALAGFLLVNLAGQSVASTLPDIQGGVGLTSDEGSWLTTVYSMASFAGVVCSTPLMRAFGLGRYTAAAALAFALAGLGCALASPLALLLGLRAVQGFAAGGFGPGAFMATFAVMRGPRQPLGLSLLALTLLLPAAWGPAVSGFLDESLGWQAVFPLQGMAGGALAAASILFIPRPPIALSTLKADWAALLLLAVALAASLLLLGQGTRRYWLDSQIITWSVAVAAGGWAGFLATLTRSPSPAIDVGLLSRRGFLVPILLNLLFRAGFASTAYLVPQFLVLIQGYRPLELSRLFLWTGVAQLIAFPLALWLLRRTDGRLVAASGLLLFGAGVLLSARSTGLAAADQFQIALALAGAGQVLFLVPNLRAGGKVLTPADAPTASLAFNVTTLGGTSLGVALATELVTERQKFHAGALAESAAAFGAKLDGLDDLAALFAARVGDDALAAGRAVATVAGVIRRESLVLSFNDGFLLVGMLLAASAAGLLFLDRQPPPAASTAPSPGASS